MTNNKIILLFVVALVGCGSPDSQSVAVSREQVELDTGLPPNYSDTEAADFLRNFIHEKVPYNWEFHAAQFEPEYYSQLVAGELSLQCGEQSYAYRYLLKRIGVQSRYVWVAGRYPDGHEKHGQLFAHQTVEIFSDGNWWVSDPTVNAYVVCDGRRASSEDIRGCTDPVIFESGMVPNPTVYGYYGHGELEGITYVDQFAGFTHDMTKAGNRDYDFGV